MKPSFEKIVDKPGRSFTAFWVNRDKRPLLSQAWHYHPEIEICYTLESSGKRFVGNQISDYEKSDLVLFGANLPHGFTTNMKSSQVVIQMTEDFLGTPFINTPELRPIKMLFANAKRGLEFQETTKQQAKKIIKRLMNSQGLRQLLELLELLTLLAHADDAKPICSEEYLLDFDETNLERMRSVYEHIITNLHNPVKIKTVAEKVNLTEAAFYKFIKKNTKKTYTQITNEIKINYAGKLLISTDQTIAQIAFESGYNNIAYFNRKFKQITNKTPNEFKALYDDRLK